MPRVKPLRPRPPQPAPLPVACAAAPPVAAHDRRDVRSRLGGCRAGHRRTTRLPLLTADQRRAIREAVNIERRRQARERIRPTRTLRDEVMDVLSADVWMSTVFVFRS